VDIRAKGHLVLDPGPNHGDDDAVVVPVQENDLAALEHEDGRVKKLVELKGERKLRSDLKAKWQIGASFRPKNAIADNHDSRLNNWSLVLPTSLPSRSIHCGHDL
jgi:hypothetical protein